MHDATGANGVRQGKNAGWREGAIENDESSPSCVPRQEVSGMIADVKSARMSSRRDECCL